jgi:translocation and assembly module TamB
MTRKRILWALASLFLLGLVAAFWYVASGELDRYAARKAVEAVRDAIGAELRFETLRIDPLRGRALASGVVLSGTGRPGGKPLFQAETLAIDVNWRLFISPGVELKAIEVVKPEFHVEVYADGTNNLPKPRGPASGANPIDQLVALRLGKLTARDGVVSWNDQATPFQLAAEGVRLEADYLPASRAYRGGLRTAKLSFATPEFPDEYAAVSGEFLLDASKLELTKLRAEKNGDWVNGEGTLTNLQNLDAAALRAELNLQADVSVAEVNRFFTYPVEKNGRIRFDGKLNYEARRGVELHGDAKGDGIYYRDASTRIGPAAAAARIDYIPSRLTLSDLEARAYGGVMNGAFSWEQQKGWVLEGKLNGLGMARLAREAGVSEPPWDASASGALRASGGKQPLSADIDLNIDGQQQRSKIEGFVGISYDGASESLEARDSFLRLPSTSVKFAGNLASGLRFEFVSSDAREWEPLLRWQGWKEEKLPLRFDGGSVKAAGVMSGKLDNLAVRGNVLAQSFHVYERPVQRLSANVAWTPELLKMDAVEIDHALGKLRGNAALTLSKDQPAASAPLNGAFDFKLHSLQAAAKEFGVAGVSGGGAELSGSVKGSAQAPLVSASLRAPLVEVHGEKIEDVSAVFTADRNGLRAPEVEARIARNPLRASLELKAQSEDWKRGAAIAKLRTDRLPLNALRGYRSLDLAWGGQVSSDLDLNANWTPEGVTPTKIDGKLSLLTITRFDRPVGQLEFTSRTNGNRAALTVQGAIRQQPVKGDATIRLTSQLDTELRLQLPRLDFPSIAQLFSRERIEGPLPYEGSAEASVYLQGPLLDTAQWDGTFTIPQLALAPNKEYVQSTLPRVSDVVLRNEGPIVLRYNKGVISARATRFTAKDTNFNADFIYRMDSQTLGGRANGRINLAVLSTLQPELLAGGVANLDATLAGQVSDPRLNGKLSFENASFYLRDVITGLDKVNGTLLFDQNRATIESLRAQAGGGNLQLTGFVGFGKLLTYRLQAQADQVRIRYPEGVSTTANATLALTGTTDQSILSGSVTVLRANVGQVDTSQFLASSSGAGGGDAFTVSENRYLKNLQFDVRVDAAQNAEFSTSLTRDVKGEIALRLRGTPQRPALIGRISVTQGEIDFFGSRYTISRGELRFENPLKIDPVINMDLETRVRGVIINMTFTGQANKLNMTYRSDPPLQSNEILALLTVGRNPNSTSTSVVQTQNQNQGMFGNDSSVLIGAAVSAGINGRLQRFFGISRVRLDPQLTGIDNVPQARLTLEQQVSRDVTLTYITNLNRTQQQIVRLDWDISRTWSVVAVRDENGVFGVDLFFRKRLK